MTVLEEELNAQTRPPHDLMEEHYKELHRMGMELKPDWKAFDEDQKAGRLAYVTAWHDGRMVGYALIVLNPHRHYSADQLATLDAVYLQKPYRGGGWGKLLLMNCEAAAKRKGASVISFRCKARQSLQDLYESMHYTLEDYVFVKDLRDARS